MAIEITHQVQNNICLLSMTGNLTTPNLDEIASNTESFFAHLYSGYVISLNNVHLMDSNGMGWIANSFTKLRSQQIKLVICSLNPIIKELFKFSNLDKVIQIYPNETEALNSFDFS